MADIRNEHEETARLYAEEKMPMNWDRQDPESIGVFYQYYIQRLKELWTPSPPPEGNTPASEQGEKPISQQLKEIWKQSESKSTWVNFDEMINRLQVVDGYLSEQGIPKSYGTRNNLKIVIGALDDLKSDTAPQSPPSLQKREKGWIKIETRLPEVDTPVYVRTEYESSGKPMVDFFTAYMDEYGDCIICPHDESYGWEFNDCVTHWQPLPSPPNESQDTAKQSK